MTDAELEEQVEMFSFAVDNFGKSLAHGPM